MLILVAILFAAQPEPRPAEPKPTAPPPSTIPSLDDLLGTKPDKPAPKPATLTNENPAPADAPPDDTDPDRAGLDRLLTGAEIGDAFSEAITLMGDAAKRLEDSRDTGIKTQRVQEDVVRRLDQLLASLQRQQSSSSSSSSSSQSQQDQQQGKSQPNQRKPGSKQTQQSQSGDGNQQHDGPPKQEGALKPALDSARAAWGSLPARIRDMLLQGSEDPFSATYKSMTEAYYRKLAEEKK
ncbi:MAG: hypothetical protein IT438_16860 [Phycisphaerales bacterium]|nr:hypothetical protein [Phycisphaerales bacterium]